eukprot:9499917-Pyramimonas_sp.AAC.1
MCLTYANTWAEKAADEERRYGRNRLLSVSPRRPWRHAMPCKRIACPFAPRSGRLGKARCSGAGAGEAG